MMELEVERETGEVPDVVSWIGVIPDGVDCKNLKTRET